MKVMDYVLSCSSTCDLDREMLRENNIEFACFKYIIDGKEYEDNFYQSYDYRKFYEDISNGMKPTTSQVGYGDYIEFFKKFFHCFACSNSWQHYHCVLTCFTTLYLLVFKKRHFII